MIKVFVYGTLRKGEANHPLLNDATCIAEQCWTNGVLYDTGYGYPAIKQSSSSRVYGELYLVPKKNVARLDQLEGYRPARNNNLYDRIEQTIHMDKGSCVAFVYVADQVSLLKRKIVSGDWKEHTLLSREREETVLYFAYGSCMDQKRFVEDGFADYFQTMLGVGVLQNYSLGFTRKSLKDGMGRADIVEGGGTVEGKVYEIPIKALSEYLYAREGAPTAYRVTFITIELNGQKVHALTFVGTNKKPETAPPEWYEEEILRGANGFLTDPYILKIQTHMNNLKKSKGGR